MVMTAKIIIEKMIWTTTTLTVTESLDDGNTAWEQTSMSYEKEETKWQSTPKFFNDENIVQAAMFQDDIKQEALAISSSTR